MVDNFYKNLVISLKLIFSKIKYYLIKLFGFFDLKE